MSMILKTLVINQPVFQNNPVFLICKFLYFIMGNSNDSKSFLQKDEGLRILSIKLNSPFDGKVQPFFDFIIDVIELEPQQSPKQILDRLTGDSSSVDKKKPKDFNQIIQQNEQRKLQIKVLSTKLRNVRSIRITPNRNWNGKKDMIGITTRKQNYNEVFDTYFPVSNVQRNSPIQLAGVKNGEYLLGCIEFPYTTLQQFIEGLSDRFFDKEVADKRVHLALYDIISNEVNIKPVLLQRGWGDLGLVGCQFLQGQLYKFPHNLLERRQQILDEQKQYVQISKINAQIKQCIGASKTLASILLKKRSNKVSSISRVKNIMKEDQQGCELFRSEQTMKSNQQEQNQQQSSTKHDIKKQRIIQHQNLRINFLQRRVSELQTTLQNLRCFLDEFDQEQNGIKADFQQKK